MQRRTRHQAACAAWRGRARAAERRGAPRAEGAGGAKRAQLLRGLLCRGAAPRRVLCPASPRLM